MSPMRDLEDRRPPLSPQLAMRVAVLGGVALALFAVIFFRLWFLQVLSGEEYLVEARENRTREVREQAPRGEIGDRNGNTLVEKRVANVDQLVPSSRPATGASGACWTCAARRSTAGSSRGSRSCRTRQ